MLRVASLKTKKVLLWLGLVFLLSFFLARLTLPWGHTLENLGAWESTKVKLERGVMGGVAFIITPLGLVGDRLNLGAWHGFQEMWWRPEVIPQELQFQLELSEQAYVDVMLRSEDGTGRGVRLSTHPGYPSRFFITDAEQRFTRLEPLEKTKLPVEPQNYEILFSEQGMELRAGEESLGIFPGNFSSAQRLGFRGSSGASYLDEVVLQGSGGEIFREDFAPGQSLLHRMLWMGLGILFVNGLVFGLRRNYQTLLAFNVMALLMVIPLDLANRFFFTRNYQASKLAFKAMVKFTDYESNIETKAEAVARLAKEYPLKPRGSGKRILVVGTSQTWGAGALRAEDTMVARLEVALRQDPRWGEDLQIINAGISGEKAGSLLELFQDQWIKWQPDLILINLSNNDQDSEKFSRDMEGWLQLTTKEKISMVLIQEPNSPEQIRENLPRNHAILAELASSHGVPLISLHECLVAKEDGGFLWWDFVHLSSLGQELGARCLIQFFERDSKT